MARKKNATKKKQEQPETGAIYSVKEEKKEKL